MPSTPDFFFQIILFLAGAIVGVVSQILSSDHRKLKILLAILAILFIITAFAWTKYQIVAISTPTSTVVPPKASQTLLLRGRCSTDYVVRANEPIFIYYGGWSLDGLDLAEQWTTSLVIDLVVDGFQVSGEQQTPSADLPLNCPKNDFEGSYWIYYTTTISGLSLGEHNVTVTFSTIRALPDSSGGENYQPGQIVVDTFKIIAK